MSATAQMPVSALRKGQLVMLQGHPCKITEIVTSKMMSTTSGRAPPTSYWCDAAGCRRHIMGDQVRYHCLDCANFDLCEMCEPRAVPLHATGHHVFAKYRKDQ